MPIRRVCPKCEETVRLPDDTEGRKVKCPECKASFVVPEDDEPDERPRSRRRAVEEEDRPRRRREEEPEGGSNWKLFVGIGAGAVALLVVGAAVAVFALSGKRNPEVVNGGDKHAPAPQPDQAQAPKPPAPPGPKPLDQTPVEQPVRFRPPADVRIPADAPFTADLTAAPGKVLAVADGQPLSTEFGAGGSPTIVEPLPGGVVALARPDQITFWDVKADKPAGAVKLDNTLDIIAMSATPDGETLLVHGRNVDRDSILFGVDVRERKQAWRQSWALTRTHRQALTLSTSTDGRVAFVGTVSRTNVAGVQLFDPRTGRPGPHRNDQYATALGSPDERLALMVYQHSSGTDFTLKLWDTVRDVTLGYMVIPGGPRVREERATAFSPDGRALVFFAGSTLYVFEAAAGKLVHKVKVPAPPTRKLSFSANSRLLAWFEDSDGRGQTAAYVFDLATGTELARTEVGETARATAAGLSPDGGTLFVGSGLAVSRYALPAPPPAPAGAVFPGSAPRPKPTPTRATPPTPVANFTPPAAPVTIPATAPPTYVIAGVPPRVLSAEDTYLINPLDRFYDTGAIAALPDGTVATAAKESIQLWDPVAGRWEGEIKAKGLAPSILVAAPGGNRLFAIARSNESSGTTLLVGFDVTKRAELWRYNKASRESDLGVSTDGSRVWLGSGFPGAQVRSAVIQAGTGQELASVAKRTVAPSPDPARGFFISREAKVEDYTFFVRGDAAEAETPYLKITGSKDTTLRHHNLQRPTLSPSGRLLAFVYRNHLIVLETATAKVLHRVELNHAFAFPPVFSPDERYLAWRDGNTLSQGGKAGYVFDLTAGKEVARFEPAEKFQVRGITFTADSRSLVVVMGEVLLRVPIPPTEK